MGLDFLYRVAPSFKKSWTYKRQDLAAPDLFTQPTVCSDRLVLADVLPGQTLQVGEELVIQVIAGGIQASRSTTTVARIGTPPAEIVSTIASAGGMALGTVTACHELSQSVDILIK